MIFMERLLTDEGYILGAFGFIELYRRLESPFKPRSEQVLMVLRKNSPYANHWSLPGGGVMRKEKIENTCKREVKEETDMNVSVGPLLGIVKFLGDDEKKYEAHCFRCKPLNFGFKKGEEVYEIKRVD